MTQVKFRGGMPAAHLPFMRLDHTAGPPAPWPPRRGPAPCPPRPPGPRPRWPASPRPVLGAGPACRRARRGRARPRKRLRLVPTSTPAQPAAAAAATSSGRWRSSDRLWAGVLPKPMPGSTQTSPTPAARAARGPLEHEAVDLGHHVAVAGVVLHGARARPACAWPPSRRRAPAATSHSEAEMSLTSVAPAATRGRGHRRP